jgi:DNA ligase (NAD+)
MRKSDEMMTKKAYNEAVRRLEEAAMAYYDSETLLMDDGEYDELMQAVQRAEAQNPSWGKSDVSTKVAGGQSRGGDVKHNAAMLSLDNAYSDEELTEWYERMLKVIDTTTPELCVEPKLDGLALAARYEQGVLRMVITRGDGETGENVTRQAARVIGLPQNLSTPLDLEIRGECVMTTAQFEKANIEREAAGKAAFANPRNAVAGSIRKVHGESSEMTFCAYGVVGTALEDELSHTEVMAYLTELGVNTAIQMAASYGAGIAGTIDDAIKACNEIAKNRSVLDCGIDGAVVKANRAAERRQAGATGKAPRWATARKFPPDTKLTVLRDIECSVGRTGALTVRAVLEPVAVGGVIIESCTLSNPSEIARKDIRVGDHVWVRRAGEVIPEITGVAIEKREKSAEPWVAPHVCPRCATELDRTQKVWRCPNGRACGLGESLLYAVSREALDIEGLGEKVLNQLIAAGLLTDVADIYTLEKAAVAGLDRMGDTSAQKIISEIETSKALPLSRVLVALGVRHTGRRMCRRLAGAFSTMDALLAADVEKLAAVDGVGEVRAASIKAELEELRSVIDRLAKSGVNMTEPREAKIEGGALEGKRVCVTGSVPGLNRDEAHALVERLGGTVVSGVTKKTDLLVVGDGGGSKAKKAAELGVTVMAATDLLAL